MFAGFSTRLFVRHAKMRHAKMRHASRELCKHSFNDYLVLTPDSRNSRKYLRQVTVVPFVCCPDV